MLKAINLLDADHNSRSKHSIPPNLVYSRPASQLQSFPSKSMFDLCFQIKVLARYISPILIWCSALVSPVAGTPNFNKG